MKTKRRLRLLNQLENGVDSVRYDVVERIDILERKLSSLQNEISIVIEGFTLSKDARKILETAYWKSKK